jgi:hypothetical protein
MPLRATFKTAKNTTKINHESTRMDTNKNKPVDILLKGEVYQIMGGLLSKFTKKKVMVLQWRFIKIAWK